MDPHGLKYEPKQSIPTTSGKLNNKNRQSILEAMSSIGDWNTHALSSLKIEKGESQYDPTMFPISLMNGMSVGEDISKGMYPQNSISMDLGLADFGKMESQITS